ncbi:MAG: C39 family peptidase [bacterium]|nr:C39 family peptidase [bacterium]
MKKRILIILIVLIFLAGAGVFLRFVIGGPEDDWICVENQWVKHGNPSFSMPTERCGEQVKSKETPVVNSEPEPVKAEPIKEEEPQIILLDVPFLAQAPLGQWENPIYQNACEEASLFTAILWVRGVKSISKEDVTEELKKFADFEIEKYNNFYDHSTADTAQIMKDYFGYYNIEVREDISAEDIIEELKIGNLVIVPINGQILKNPFYTPPGPDRHMLPIIGYDFETEEFITNDVGTRHGEKFRYKKDNLEASIRDYPTGHKEPIAEIKKPMIVIWR